MARDDALASRAGPRAGGSRPGGGAVYPPLKRICDIALSTLALLMLWPLLLLIALCVKLDSEGPVFFRQKRIGRAKKTFHILKFRTMRLGAPNDTPTHLLVNPEAYITRVGGILRRTSLDELPQILNILRGEMSVVGPRPALWNQEDLVAERDRYGANDLRPGLTGWAQVNGRDELEISLKARLDGEYVARMSPGFDCLIVLKTLLQVIKRDGVVEGGTEARRAKSASHAREGLER